MAFSFYGGKMDKTIIGAIQEFIKGKRDEANIWNVIVRDDVFAILERECYVLYYALEDDIDGCHICKPLNGEMKQFVYINTSKVLQEQVWTAAHELGHVWRVDQYVKDNIAMCEVEAEKIVGRFTAEFLIPTEIFRREAHNRLKYNKYMGGSLTIEIMMDLVIYLMNYFCVPAKAIIKRMEELGNIKEEDFPLYLNAFKANKELYDQIIRENQYTRLDKKEDVYKIANLKGDLEFVEKQHLAKDKYIQTVRKKFHINNGIVGDSKLEYKG